MKNLLVKRYDDGKYYIIPSITTPNRVEYEVFGESPSSELDEMVVVDDAVFGKKAVMDPTKVAAKLAQEQSKTAAAALVAYKGLRQAAYPAMGDQLDAMYKARLGQPADLEAIDLQIAAVKIQYPKP